MSRLNVGDPVIADPAIRGVQPFAEVIEEVADWGPVGTVRYKVGGCWYYAADVDLDESRATGRRREVR